MKYLTNRAAIGSAIIAILLACALFIFPAFQIATAANTHSIDLEMNSDQYLSVTDDTALDITGDMTIEAWVKPETKPNTSLGEDTMTFVSKWDSDNGSDSGTSYLFRHIYDSGDIVMQFCGSSAGSGASEACASVTHDIGTGAWKHIAVVYDASAGSAEFFVDGNSIGTDTGLPNSIYNSSSPFLIGGYLNTTIDPNFFYDGLIDEVRVWNYERTVGEIADDRSRELNGNETGLMGYWKLNNGNLQDFTNNDNDLSEPNSSTDSSDTPFVGFSSESLLVRKNSNESVVSSTILQNDNDLKLSLATNESYIIDGVIFASSTSSTPDIKMAFFGQSDITVRVGYTNSTNDGSMITSGQSSPTIEVPNGIVPIHINGTVKTSSTSGDLQLKWAQATSNGAATTVMEGSYLRAEAI